MQRLRHVLIVLAVLLLAVPMSAQVSESEPVLGHDGTIFRLLKGNFGELFGDPEAANAEHPVLALEITDATGAVALHLVPGTETRDREASPVLLLEEASQVLYLLWEELFNGIHPSLQLTSFDGEVWAPVVDISSGPFSRKGSPRLEVTRDGGGVMAISDAMAERTIAHLTWWQGGTVEASNKFYSPIVLSGRSEETATPVFDLAGFFARGEDASDHLDPVFADLLTIEPGPDSRSTVIAFLDSRTHQIRILRNEMIPHALTAFSDKARLEIVITGHRVHAKQALANEMRQQLTTVGEGLHPASLAYMVERVANFIEAWEGDLSRTDELELMADKARLEIVITGSTIDANGLPANADAYILEVGQLAEGAGRPSLLKISHGGAWSLPEIDDRLTDAKLFVAGSGRQVLLAWEGSVENRVYYRLSNDGGWSDASYLDIRPDLDRDTVYRLLAEQVRNH